MTDDHGFGFWAGSFSAVPAAEYRPGQACPAFSYRGAAVLAALSAAAARLGQRSSEGIARALLCAQVIFSRRKRDVPPVPSSGQVESPESAVLCLGKRVFTLLCVPVLRAQGKRGAALYPGSGHQ